MSDREQDDLRTREEDRKAARSELIRWLAEMLVDEAIREPEAPTRRIPQGQLDRKCVHSSVHSEKRRQHRARRRR